MKAPLKKSVSSFAESSVKMAAIASGHSEVTAVAKRMLDAGGNAFDAVVAAGFTSALAEPALTSLGGGGFCLTHDALGNAQVYDFFCNTPGLGVKSAEKPHFEEVAIRFPGAVQHFHIGRASVAVPGLIKGLLKIHQELGTLSLAEVLAPAIAHYRNGLVINAYQAKLLALLDPILRATKESAHFYAPKGQLLQEGDLIQSAQTADLLEALVKDGADAFYKGTLAKAMAADSLSQNGLLSQEDLAAYEVVKRAPLRYRYRGYEVLTNPSPSLGGSLITLGLHLLAQADFSHVEFQGPAHVQSLLGTMVEVEALRERGILSPAQLKNPAESAARALPEHVFSRGTTHMSIADSFGNVASMTTSNGEGSGVMVPGTDIMLNNMMGEDDLHPAGFHSCAAGLRVGSMMSPTLVLDADKKAKLVLGSGGSKRIRTAILQVLNHVIDFQKPLLAAVAAPRLHWDGEAVQIEPDLSEASQAALASMKPCNLWQERNVYFGGVHALVVGEAAVGDARRGGHALVFDVK